MNTTAASAADANPFGKGFCFQSSPSHLKRFIMFDNSGGHGRVFVHPALAQELFGSTHRRGEGQDESKGKQPVASNPSQSDESAMKIIAYRKVVASAFSSLQMLRNSRQINMESMEQKLPTMGMLNIAVEDEARVSGAIDVAALHVPQIMANAHMASETLACETEPKVLATLLSAKRSRVSETSGSMGFSPFSQSLSPGDVKQQQQQQADIDSTEGWENPDDLDALLSSDDDDDDDVRSTGHSPGESSEKGESCNEEDDDYNGVEEDDDDDNDDDQVQQKTNKRARIGQEELLVSFREDDDDDGEVQQKTNKRARIGLEGLLVSFKEEAKNKLTTGVIEENASKQGDKSLLAQHTTEQENANLHVQDGDDPVFCRRQKIKKTMKVLRKMIPGGAFLDPAVVLDETIHYLKSLREQVNQIESTRFPAQL